MGIECGNLHGCLENNPFVAIILLAGLQVIPRDLHSAARVDGAGSEAVLSITLPLLKTGNPHCCYFPMS